MDLSPRLVPHAHKYRSTLQCPRGCSGSRPGGPGVTAERPVGEGAQRRSAPDEPEVLGTVDGVRTGRDSEQRVVRHGARSLQVVDERPVSAAGGCLGRRPGQSIRRSAREHHANRMNALAPLRPRRSGQEPRRGRSGRRRNAEVRCSVGARWTRSARPVVVVRSGAPPPDTQMTPRNRPERT